ncbi:MAG: hypothetical protein ACFFBP_06550 [Promethearchaeota archaeon]
MSHIYVPIDASNVREAIPPGEDIVYSSYMKATDSYYDKTITYNSHVLLTPNGFAWTCPGKKKKDPIQSKYHDWSILRTVKSKLLFLWGKLGVDKFELLRIEGAENKDDFKKRAELFPEFVFSLALDYVKRKHAEIENDPSVKDKEKRELLEFIRKKSAALEKAKIKADKIREKYGE